jgi:protocatechuate 3,4-dioxygenase beta subunit
MSESISHAIFSMRKPVFETRHGDRIVTRRRALTLIGASGAALLAGLAPGRSRAQSIAGDAPPSCKARPEQTEGPFFVEEALSRSDIRSDPRTGEVKAGVPLRITFHVSRLSGASCAPLSGARIDVWHSDAAGRYSDVRGFAASTTGQQFLRGFQLTDATGSAQFLTIFPGWYGGRAVHLHFKIRAAAAAATYHGFTSQVYFDDALTERVFATEPYASRGRRWMRNGDDAIFRDGGRELLLAAEPDGPGYIGSFDLGLRV